MFVLFSLGNTSQPAEAGPTEVNVHAASAWLLLCNREVLILTAPSFRDKKCEVKMNLRQERWGSANNCFYCEQVESSQEREENVAAISAAAHNPPQPHASKQLYLRESE